MSRKYALIIGNTEYTDPGLAQLTAPGNDAEDFARLLKDKGICAFDEVNVLLNQPEHFVRGAIDEFLDQKKPDDLLVLYFSGHGVRDELGSLYLAVKNTNRTRLRSTAIKSDYIREAMDQSRSKRQVLILDCCNSGAFPQGTKAEVGGTMGIVSALQGYGRFVLTASDATQFAWEGNKIIGETQNSLFTHFLVKGLGGEADNNGDGMITVDELYDYAYEQISNLTPNQTPTKSASKQEGEIVLRQITRIQDIKPLALPDQLVSEIENPYPEVRLRAVQQLAKLLTGKNLGMTRSAREALERIEKEDDSRRVSEAATLALASIHQAEPKVEVGLKAKEDAERLATSKAEEERLAREQVESERKAREDDERLARAQAEQEAAERDAARLKAEREATEKAAREAEEKAAKEKAQEAANREAALKAEYKEIELVSRKKADQEITDKVEREAMELAARRKAERETEEKAIHTKEKKVAKPSWLMFGTIGGAIIILMICGFAAIRLLSPMFGGAETPVATEKPAITEAPATSLPMEEIIPTTEAPIPVATTVEPKPPPIIAPTIIPTNTYPPTVPPPTQPIPYRPAVWGWARGDFDKKASEMGAAGYGLEEINTYVVNGQEIFNAIWIKTSEDRPAVWGWARGDFDKKASEMGAAGYGLEEINTYVVNEQTIFNAIWVKTGEDRPAVWGWARGDFDKKAADMGAAGYQLKEINTYVVNGQTIFNAIWIKTNVDRPAVWGWARGDFDKKASEMGAAGYQLEEINTYVVNGQTIFNAIWIK